MLETSRNFFETKSFKKDIVRASKDCVLLLSWSLMQAVLGSP